MSVDTGVAVELEGRLAPNGTVPQQPTTNSTSTRHNSTMADVIPPVSDAADSLVASSARVELPDATTQPPKSTAAERLSHDAATTARYTHRPAKPPRPLGYAYPLASRSERRCAALA